MFITQTCWVLFQVKVFKDIGYFSIVCHYGFNCFLQNIQNKCLEDLCKSLDVINWFLGKRLFKRAGFTYDPFNDISKNIGGFLKH